MCSFPKLSELELEDISDEEISGKRRILAFRMLLTLIYN